MIDEHDVREMLHRRANTVSAPPADTPTAVRRARRRLALNGAVATVAAAAIAVATFAGIDAIRSAPIPADDPSEELGIFAPISGRILSVNDGIDQGYDPGIWGVDPFGPSDKVEGLSVGEYVTSTLVRLDLEDASPLGWSSDGTELLLVRSVGDSLFPEQYLSILHADGSETRLNEDPMGISSATISPDGTRVVFAGQYDLSGLYVIDAEGGRPVPLPIPQAEGGASEPTFSPDGTQIAYLAGNREAQVWVANTDGTDAHEILAEPTVIRGVTGLEWAPAGNLLAIGVGDHEGGGRPTIYTFPPDGSQFTKVITGGISPFWSPDGSRIAYTIPCDEQPDDWCPEGSIRRSEFDPQPGESPAGLAIGDADGSNIRAFGFAASGPWHHGTSVEVAPSTPPETPGVMRENGEVLHFTGVMERNPETGKLESVAAGDLVSVEPRTGEVRLLVEDLDTVYSAKWSADGRWLAYETGTADGGTELWVVGASAAPRAVASGDDSYPYADPRVELDWKWSPTGAELATIEDSETLRTIDVATGETTDLGAAVADLLGRLGASRAWAWSPDGSRFVIAPVGAPDDLNDSLYSVDAQSGERALLARLPDQEGPIGIGEIRWSPDGAHIAVGTNGGDYVGRLYVMNADGTDIRLVTDESHNFGFAWSPDGTRLAFGSGGGDREVRIRVTTTDDTAAAEIGTIGPNNCYRTSWGPAFGCSVTWSPDGTQVAFRKEETGRVTVFDAIGAGEAARLDELTYLSWDGGWYESF